MALLFNGIARALMNDKQPTPIPLRASRKKAPEPLMFPQPNPNVHVSKMGNVDDLPFSRKEVLDLLKEHDIRQARAFYKVIMDWPIAEIMVMGEAEFVALYRSVLEDE
jgi:hypothetical protein